MIQNKILRIFVLFIICTFPFFTFADSDSFMTSKIDSDWGDGFCYKFNLGNESNETIFSWKINFDLEEGTQITGIRGGKQTKSGNKYTITGLDRNSNLNIGHKGVEVGFCANGKQKPSNVIFIKGEKKHSQKHYTNKREHDKNEEDDEVDYEYNVDENADEPSEFCSLNTDVISKTNLVKNGGFEIFNTGNIFSDWFKKRKEDYHSFVGKLSKLEYWDSINDNYKIWKNGDIKAQEGEAFIDIDLGNTISQEIKTGSGKKYELSFYSLGTDELEVKWNGKSIHKKANTYSGVKITETVPPVTLSSIMYDEEGKKEKKKGTSKHEDDEDEDGDDENRDEDEENYSSGIQNKAGWVKYSYTVDGISGNSKLDFSNTKVIFEDEKENLQGNNYCNKFKNENSCESGVAKSLCEWEDHNCLKKDSYKYTYTCGWDNGGGIINLNYEKITIPKGKNKINCSVWGSSRKLYTGDGDDYVRYKFGDNAYINLGGGSNIFTHNVYDSQLTNSTIQGGGGFNKLILEDEDFDNFDITGDCSIECTLSLKNNIFNWWQGWRFSNIKLKRIHEISGKDSKKEFKSDKSSDYLFETDVRLGVDNVQVKEITTSSNIDKIDLMTLINDILKNNVSNGACTEIFYGLEESVKNELITKLLNSSDYTTIGSDFLSTVSDNSKLNVVKTVSYELIKDKISPCHTDAEKEAFYNELFTQTEAAIDSCVINNINAQVQKQVENISYLKSTVNSCTQSGNTLTLNFLNSYGMYSK